MSSGVPVDLADQRRLRGVVPGSPFERAAALGYSHLVPIVPPDAQVWEQSALYARVGQAGKDPRGKAPGIRRPDGKFSSFDWVRHETTADDLVSWAAMGCGVGLRLGAGIVALDVDTLSRPLSETAILALRDVIPGSHAFRVGRAPKFVVLLRVVSDASVAYRCVEFDGADGKRERIELLTGGKQIVVDGVHPVTKKPYTWHPAMPAIGDVVEVTLEQLDELFRRLAAELPKATMSRSANGTAEGATPSQASLRGDPEMVARALRALPNTTEHFPTRDQWIDIGYAIKAALPHEPELARELYAEWSDRWEDPEGRSNPRGGAEEEWARMHPPFRRGAGWLYEQLERTTGKSVGELWFDATEDDRSAAPASPCDERAFPQIHAIGSEDDRPPIPVRDWLVHPWARAGVVLALVGAAGVSKSAFALRLAVAVATGNEAIIRGKNKLCADRLHKHGPVFCFNREDDVAEMRRRIEGLRRYHELPPIPAGTLFLASGVERRLVIAERRDRGPVVPAPGWAWLRDRIREIRPVLVVLDPLISLSSGLEENNNADMEQLLGLLRALASAERTTILVVHHSGKGAERASGDAAALRGATAIVGAIRGGLTLTAQTVREPLAEGPLKGLPPGSYVVSEGVKPSYGPKAAPVVYRLKVIGVGNGEGEPLPPTAELLFDQADPGGFLRRAGDTVVVHELVDTTGAQEKARGAAVDRATHEAQAVARILDDILGNRTHALVSEETGRIGEALVAHRLTKGAGRKAVDEKLGAIFAAGSVDIENAGQRIRISVRKDGMGAKSPRIIQREVIRDDVFA